MTWRLDSCAFSVSLSNGALTRVVNIDLNLCLLSNNNGYTFATIWFASTNVAYFEKALRVMRTANSRRVLEHFRPGIFVIISYVL
jgi:hypothetical protein